MVPSASQRVRLARAFADFWYGGNGPSHGEIADAFAVAGVDPQPGSKRDRVSEAIRTVPGRDLFTLADQLMDLLRVRELPNADTATLKRLRDALHPFGIVLDDGFELRASVQPGLDHLPDLPALRDHVSRIQRSIRDGDDAQLVGSTKELLETTAKVVLERANQPAPAKFPALLTAAFDALELHPKATPSTGTPLEAPVRKILGGALQIVLGVDELRNTHGTGHGRAGPPVVLRARHARLAAGAGVTVSTLMLDTLDDPDAPWRKPPART